MNPILYNVMTHKAIAITKPAADDRSVDMIKGTGDKAKRPAGPVGCNSQACEQPIAFPVFPIKLILERVGMTRQVLDEIRLQPEEPHSHWGFNEQMKK